jgi:D-apiose dehydrogenase
MAECALRFAVFGAGFWAHFQLGAWLELPGVECAAVYNRTRSRAEALARRYGVPAVYDDPEELLRLERLDFVDVITSPPSHPGLVALAAARGVPVICQKPMAESLDEARAMVEACSVAGVPFFVHENWRWQDGIRRVKTALDSGAVGAPFRARVSHVSDYPVFSKEPWLKDWERYILADMGVHLLDTTRFLFGEARSLSCHTQRIHKDCRGEDVATVMLAMRSGLTAIVEMGYPENHMEHDIFPETHVYVEAENGTIELTKDFWLRVTTADGTVARRQPPTRYAWGEPDYLVFCSSIVPCNASFLRALRGEGEAETTGADNLRTLELTYTAYESARTGRTIDLE